MKRPRVFAEHQIVPWRHGGKERGVLFFAVWAGACFFCCLGGGLFFFAVWAGGREKKKKKKTTETPKQQKTENKNRSNVTKVWGLRGLDFEGCIAGWGIALTVYKFYEPESLDPYVRMLWIAAPMYSPEAHESGSQPLYTTQKPIRTIVVGLLKLSQWGWGWLY